MLVEAHPASVPFSTLVQIVGCMLETVHPCPAYVRIAGCMLERVHPAPPPSRVHMQMCSGVGCWAGFVEPGQSSWDTARCRCKRIHANCLLLPFSSFWYQRRRRIQGKPIRRCCASLLWQAGRIVYDLKQLDTVAMVSTWFRSPQGPSRTLASLGFYKGPFGLLNHVETIATVSNYYVDTLRYHSTVSSHWSWSVDDSWGLLGLVPRPEEEGLIPLLFRQTWKWALKKWQKLKPWQSQQINLLY